MKKKAISIIDKINNARDTFKEEHNSNNSPWDYISLSIDENTNEYWLNSAHQQYLDCGWCTEQDLNDWLEGCGRIPKSRNIWNELVFLCKHDILLHASLKKYYNWYRPDYYFHNNSITPIRHINDLLDKETEKRIESYIKFRIISTIDNENIYGINSIKRYHDVNFTKRHALEEELYGFFTALRFLGVGYLGYINNPEERKNFCWWKNLLIYETDLEWRIIRKRISIKEARLYLGFNRKEI